VLGEIQQKCGLNFNNPIIDKDPIMIGIGSIPMRSNPRFSARLCRAADTDPGHQPAIWKTVLGLFLATALISWLFAVPADAQSSRATYVSGMGLDTNPCTAAAPCLTLQTALARTAPGGQIYPLDSADYGYVTIDKAVSILAGRGATGVLATSSLSGVNVHAGPSDIVTLQGLDIDGAGSGANGIQFNSGASLNIQDSVIRGFTNGINFQPSASSTLLVSETLISNNSTGINLHGAATSTGVLNDVQLVNNGTGVSAVGTSSAGPVSLSIQNSVVANNSAVGVLSGAYSAVNVSNSTIVNNVVGLQAQNTSAVLKAYGSTVTGNGTGWLAANGGQVISSANATGGNTTGNAAPPTTAASYLVSATGAYLLTQNGNYITAQ